MKNRIIKSWETSLVGVTLISVGAFLIYIKQPEFAAVLISAGLGFIGYKQNKEPNAN